MNDVSIIVYPAADLAAAKRFFGALIGADPYADAPQYVGYKTGDMEIGLDPSGGKYGSGAIPFWTVTDITASVKALGDVGGTVVQEITDVGYGMLVARIKDPNGSLVGLRQHPSA